MSLTTSNITEMRLKHLEMLRADVARCQQQRYINAYTCMVLVTMGILTTTVASHLNARAIAALMAALSVSIAVIIDVLIFSRREFLQEQLQESIDEGFDDVPDFSVLNHNTVIWPKWFSYFKDFVGLSYLLAEGLIIGLAASFVEIAQRS